MSLPFYKRFPKDFLEGTIGMDLETKGAYAIVLDLIYMRDGRLEDDPRYIAGQLGCSVRKWNSIRETLIQMGKLEVENGIISNFRADHLVEERRTYRDKKAENRSRPNKNSDLEKRASDSARVKPETEPEDTTQEAREASPTILEIRDACMRAAGLTEADVASPAMIAPSEIIHLIRPSVGAACDLELDVLPAIQSCAATLRQRGQTLKSWSYCREAILRNRDNRLNGTPAVQQDRGASSKPHASASARRHAQSDADIDAVVDQLRGRVDWPDSHEDDEAARSGFGGRGRIVDLEPTEFAWRTGTDR